MSPGKVELYPPEEVRRIAATLEEAGFSTWAVGGAVRDSIAGRRTGDWDLATAARPRDVQRLFRRTVPVGIEHGTVGVLGSDRRLYEVTTFRRDVETFGRHAVVSFADTVEEDLDRRDFTINAVAWHPLSGELRDPHGGRADLERGVLRTVGEPAQRFAEDYLRILRAQRFAGRFRLRIDTTTWRDMLAAAHFLRELSAERVREELMKLLRELDSPSDSLRLYQASGTLRELYPELDACATCADCGGADVWGHLLAAVDTLPRRSPRLRLATLLHDIGKPNTRESVDGQICFPDHAAAGAALARQLMARLKASNADTDYVVHLVAQHESIPAAESSPAEQRRWASRVGREFVRDLFRLHFANRCARIGSAPGGVGEAVQAYRATRRTLATQPPLTVGDLAIGGTDLRELGLRPSPQFGEVLRSLLERVLEDPGLNTQADLQRIVIEEILGRMKEDDGQAGGRGAELL